jgi:hypothetical protein
MIRKLAFASLLFVVVACKKEEPPAPTEVAVVPPAAPAAAPTPTPAEPTVDLESVPVEEDFEEEAEKELTVANLPKKLDELEKEIDAP